MRRTEQQVRWFAQLDEFEREAEVRVAEVSFDNPEAERIYERNDWSLHSKIEAVFVEAGLIGIPSSAVHMVEDWWPNKTKSVEAAFHVLSAPLLTRLQSTLHGEHHQWCINVQIYADLSDSATWMGVVNLYVDEIIGTSGVSGVLTFG